MCITILMLYSEHLAGIIFLFMENEQQHAPHERKKKDDNLSIPIADGVAAGFGAEGERDQRHASVGNGEGVRHFKIQNCR